MLVFIFDTINGIHVTTIGYKIYIDVAWVASSYRIRQRGIRRKFHLPRSEAESFVS